MAANLTLADMLKNRTASENDSRTATWCHVTVEHFGESGKEVKAIRKKAPFTSEKAFLKE